MPETTNEVIVERIHGLTKLIEEKFEANSLKLDQNSKEHTTLQLNQEKTNGRLRGLEKWQNKLVGAWAVISILLVGVLIPLVNYYIQNKK